MPIPTPNAFELHIYLERLSNLLRAEAWRAGQQHGLQPIQLQMLAYLQRCNRYSNTPAAVTEYFGLTKGTVSQSLKILEDRGLIAKSADTHDRRVVHLHLTEAGRAVLGEAMLPAPFQQLDAYLPISTQVEISTALRLLLTALQRANGARSFGVCATCRYHLTEEQGRYRCGLTQEPLLPHEIQLICREHEEKEP
jgi:DNA-binding MarR family transcriptional regulator